MESIEQALAVAIRRHQAGDLHAAEGIYRQILRQDPRQADALHLLGMIAHQVGQHNSALNLIRSAIEIDPNAAPFHNNLGGVNMALGNLPDAVRSFQRAVELMPESSEHHYNLGNALQELGELDRAVASFERALQLAPEHAATYNNLGNTLSLQWKLAEAAECYRRALQLQPESLDFRCKLVHQLQLICSWAGLEELSRQVVDALGQDDPRAKTQSIAPFSFLVLPTPTTAEQQYRCARRWVDRRLQAAQLPAPATRIVRDRPRDAKITLGYLSADFHVHATSMLVAELFERHDRSRFDVVGYSYGPDDGSSTRSRIVRSFDRFRDLKDVSIPAAAQQIAADGVDILVDLKGYTLNCRPQILALRPAPIQVNYLGYPGTMGADFMDYILVDEFIVPPEQQPYYAERLVHLPGCYQVNDSQRTVAPRTPTRRECGLPHEGFVFCCFNNNYKITPKVFDVWMRLLQAVPGSVLWLLEGNRYTPPNLRREAASRCVSPDRLVFAPKVAPPEYLARQRIADLFLDTFPVNAHTTASDALWVGLPLITLAGDTFVSRVAGSLLRAVGLPELVTTTWEQYESLALDLARDRHRLDQLRSRLAANRETSDLFQGQKFARHVEQAYFQMWQYHQLGERPRPFAVG
jgi:predicted O-linked N-acetylglucosamine transferase (SPINDLY family)